jgi:DnaK suppressor protein
MSGYDGLRVQLEQKKDELGLRLDRITQNLRRGLNADSKEQAKELEDSEVVDALGNEARRELSKIAAALSRMDSGEFGICTECGENIEPGRLTAYPYADECIECAEFAERKLRRL